jgi:hypothetical protein
MPFACGTQLCIWFAPHFTQNFIKSYAVFVQLIIFLQTYIFLILNLRASLLLESDAISGLQNTSLICLFVVLQFVIKILTVLLPLLNPL